MRKQKQVNLVPSICAALTYDYESLIKKLLKSGIKMFHFDVMDASLTSNAWINLDLLKLLPQEAFAEIHIMAKDPIKFIKCIPYRKNTFIQTHLRMQTPFVNFIKEVKKYHFLPGITFDLNDDLNLIDISLIKQITLVNFMAVREIGLTNQIFCDEVYEKIKLFKKLFPKYNGCISVDGSVRETHLFELSKLCNSIVIGSILYKSNDYHKQLKTLKALIKNN